MKYKLALFALPVFAQPPLPEGAGKEVVLRVCTACHGVEVLARGKRVRERWQRTVDDMARRGAKGSDADFKSVVDYLTANFGIAETEQPETVNVNKAAGWRIARSLKLSAGEGDAVVIYREEHGDFKSLDDLAKVVDRGKIEAAKDRVLF
jgi:DNA uptake protein ComE-like DNA-binding protein